jgi:hypothetical protein
VFSSGQGRKTDATGAHSIAVVAVRTRGLQAVAAAGDLSRCGCWPTVGTSSLAPTHVRSADCTGCCSS